MNAHQRRCSMRNKKRKLGEYLTVVKVLGRLNSHDIAGSYTDEQLLNLFSLNKTFEGYPRPPLYWWKKWERC